VVEHVGFGCPELCLTIYFLFTLGAGLLLFLFKEKVTKSSSEFDGEQFFMRSVLLRTRDWYILLLEVLKCETLLRAMRDNGRRYIAPL
jgi:hypothetical protein